MYGKIMLKTSKLKFICKTTFYIIEIKLLKIKNFFNLDNVLLLSLVHEVSVFGRTNSFAFVTAKQNKNKKQFHEMLDLNIKHFL